MELFLPSFLVIGLAGILVFLVIPRFTPFMIFVLCAIFLAISISIHLSMFSDQYKSLLSTGLLQGNATGIIIAIIVIGVIVSVLNLFAGFKFKLPSVSFGDDSHYKVISSKGYKNIPLERFHEFQKQI